jgi:hypothetical protein
MLVIGFEEGNIRTNEEMKMIKHCKTEKNYLMRKRKWY